jgi:hypothetical protein
MYVYTDRIYWYAYDLSPCQILHLSSKWSLVADVEITQFLHARHVVILHSPKINLKHTSFQDPILSGLNPTSQDRTVSRCYCSL